MTTPMIAVLAAVSIVSVAALVFRRPKVIPLTPAQQIYADAIDLIQRVGLSTGGLTMHGHIALGTNLPHDIIGAVAACDPDYRGSVYALPSVSFLRQFSLAHVGMYPEDVNDRLGITCVLTLLEDAIAARA